jgi:ribonuclease D
VKHRKPVLYDTDLPEDVLKHYLTKQVVAVDTETRGLQIARDRLCLIQLCDDEGVVSFVRYTGKPAPNLVELFLTPTVLKLFHFGRFDIAVLKHYMQVDVNPIWCTKIASKLIRTYTDRHSLKDLSKELLGVEMDKSDQSSDWARTDLSDSQLEYAANDVRVLIPIYEKLNALLEREQLSELAGRLFKFLPTACELDLRGWSIAIFEH